VAARFAIIGAAPDVVGSVELRPHPTTPAQSNNAAVRPMREAGIDSPPNVRISTLLVSLEQIKLLEEQGTEP